MQKPKIGSHYKVFPFELERFNIIKVVSVSGNEAKYVTLNTPDRLFTWDFQKFPDCLNHEVSSLEMELL